MILKKPYGLLIKYFKIIHFILFILTIFIAVKTKVVVNFFQDYIKNNYYATPYENMASSYISFFLYLALFLVIVSLIALFILLRYKKKPNTLYLGSIIYYLLLFIMIIIASNLINGLNIKLWETVAARQYRDFAQIIYYPQFIIIALLGVRTLGFDVKKFDFKKDIHELELAESDSELVELNIGFDVSKITRLIRRFIREFKYYFLENKFIIIVILILIGVISAFSFTKSKEQLEFNYIQGANFNYDGFKVEVLDSLITNLDYNGQIINDDNYYLLLKLKFTNLSSDISKINYNNFKIYDNHNYYNPSLDIGNYFIDYSEPYFGDRLKSNVSKIYLFPYIINKEDINKDFKLSLSLGLSNTSKKPKTINVKLSPVIIDDVTLINNFAINQEVNFSGTYLNNTKLTIKDYILNYSYNYKYKTCEDCKEYTGYLTASTNKNIKKTLLIIDYDFYLDPTSLYYLSAQTIHSFFNHFVSIQYDDKQTKVEDITPSELKNKVILQVPQEMEKASKIDLYITIRNKKYIINLK